VPRSRGRVRRYPIRLAALPSLIFCLALALGAMACNPDDEPVGPDENPLTGGIRGTVTSSLFGPLANALVTVTPGGQTDTSDPSGNYLIEGLTPGSGSVAVTGTPSSCFPAAPQTVSVAAGGTADADFNLICRPILYSQQVPSHLDSIGIPAFEIFSIRADGSGQTAITNDNLTYMDPTWSPDGSRIAYTFDGLVVINADGTGRVALIPYAEGLHIADPAWSPDGSRIAFARLLQPFFQTDIWLINADGTGQTQVTTTDSIFETYPTWSPDGSTIAFARGGDIWKRHLGTGVETKLTTNSFDDSWPTWSPDGSRIAFGATDRDDDGSGDFYNFYELFTMNPDGTGLTRITNDEFFDLQPAWSPDGSTLVYTSNRLGTPATFTVEVAGGTPERLTPLSQRNESFPTW
jgi:Tol biopolymer transport system component